MTTIKTGPRESVDVIIKDDFFEIVDMTTWSHSIEKWITVSAEELMKADPDYFQELLSIVDKKIVFGDL